MCERLIRGVTWVLFAGQCGCARRATIDVMPSLSIVIPVYEAEEYLPGCLDTVVDGT